MNIVLSSVTKCCAINNDTVSAAYDSGGRVGRAVGPLTEAQLGPGWLFQHASQSSPATIKSTEGKQKHADSIRSGLRTSTYFVFALATEISHTVNSKSRGGAVCLAYSAASLSHYVVKVRNIGRGEKSGANSAATEVLLQKAKSW